MEEVRLYEMYLTEAIEERKTDLLNRNNEYNSSKDKIFPFETSNENISIILPN